MADREFRIHVKIDGDALAFQRSLQESIGELKQFKSELAEMNRALAGATGEIRSVRDSAKALAVDLGYAERATQSLTRYTRAARDELKAEAAALRAAIRDIADMGAASKQLADAQRGLAETITGAVIPSLEREADRAGRLGDRLITTGVATQRFAAASREGARAAEEEAAAIDHLGDEAAAAAAKLAALDAVSGSSMGPSSGGVGLGGGGADRGGGGANLSRLLWHRGKMPWPLGFVGGLGGLSLLSMLGLGAEHAITGTLAVGGSAIGAAAGAGVVGLGAAGQTLVGGLSDAAVMKSTIADTKTLGKLYENLQQAIAVYGKNSREAAVAQAKFNYEMKQLGPAAKVEFKLSQDVAKLNQEWDKLSAGARKNAVKILEQTVGLGHAYVGKVTQAAQRNLGIINESLKPLFKWLEGPQGMAIFDKLENHFAKNLPTAVDAFDQGIKLLFRLMGVASDFTGGFTKHLDQLLIRLNSHSDFYFHQKMQKLVNDLHIWEKFIKLIALDLYGLFKAGAGEGNHVIELFTKWLEHFNKWENSVKGQEWLHTFFTQRAAELIAFLKLFVPVASGFFLIYKSIQPLVPVITAVLTAVGDLLSGLEKMSPSFTAFFGLFLITGKILGFKAVINELAGAFGFLAVKEREAAAAASAVNAAALGGSALGSGARLTGTASSSATKALTSAEIASAETGMFASLRANVSKAFSEGIGKVMRGGVLALLGGTIADVVGHAVGGGIGHAVKTIGTDAAIGAGFGSMFGPAGIAGGAMLGGLVGVLRTFIRDDAPKQGREWAAKFLAPLPAAVQASFSKSLSKAAADAIRTQKEHKNSGPLVSIGPLNSATNFLEGLLGMDTKSASSKQVFNKMFNYGYLAGNAVVAGLKTVKVPTTGILTADFIAELKKLPAQARPEAAKVMLEYAAGLVKSGKLPHDAVDLMIKALSAQFPPFRAYLQRQGILTGQDLAKAMKFEKATSQLQQTLGQYKTMFGDWQINLNSTTFHDLFTNAGLAMKRLHDVIVNPDSLPDAVRKAKAELDSLRSHSDSVLKSMLTEMDGHLKEMKPLLKTGSHNAVKVAADNFGRFQSAVGEAMASGVVSSKKGADLMHQALQDTLKAFGSKQVVPAIAAVTAGAIAAQAQQTAASIAAKLGGAAGGALIQVGGAGEAGRDSVPMSVGGSNIVVAPGEKVAVFNRHQEPIVNRALAREGYAGLPGLFNSVTRKHYMAEGGLVPGYAGGGVAFSGPVSTFGPPGEAAGGTAGGHSSSEPGLSLRIPGTHWSDPRNRALMGHVFRVAIMGHQANLLDFDLGPADWTGKNIDVTGAGVAALGIPYGSFPTGAVGSVTELDAGKVTNLGGALGGTQAQFPGVKIPKVHGGGTVGKIVEASLKMMAKAADAYGQAHMPFTAAAGSGAAGVGSPGGPTGVGTYMGVAMANWVIETLRYAAAHGSGNPQPTSGYRPGFDPHTASGHSEHSGTQYPHGAVDFGGFNSGLAAKMAVVNASRGFKWPLLAPIGFHDDGHASGTGHARGGIVDVLPSFATGGLPHEYRDPFTGRYRMMTASEYRSLLDRYYSLNPAGHPGKPKKKVAKPTRPPKPPKPGFPKFKAPKGAFAQADQDQIATLGKLDREIGDLGGWYGYLQGLYGDPGSAQTIISTPNADGSTTDAVNWGSASGARGQKTGLPDPNTGHTTMGIYDWLRVIGDPGSIGSPGHRDIMTFLGVDEQILDDYNQQLPMAVGVGGDYLNWSSQEQAQIDLYTKRIAYLAKGLDLSTPLHELSEGKIFDALGVETASGGAGDLVYGKKTGKGGGVTTAHSGVSKKWTKSIPWARVILDHIKKYKNAVAQEEWATRQREQLAVQRAERDGAITARFIKARGELAKGNIRGTYDGSKFLRDQITGLNEEERTALSNVPKKAPASWLGDTSGWYQQRAHEAAILRNEFDGRKNALRDVAAGWQLNRRLKRQEAATALSLEEHAEKNSLRILFDGKRIKYNDLIRADKGIASSNKSYLRAMETSLEGTVKTDKSDLDSAGQFADTLAGYTNPIGSNAIARLTLQNITIPDMLQTISDLKGTKTNAVPSQTTADTTGAAGTTSGLDASTTGSGATDAGALNSVLQQLLAEQTINFRVAQEQMKTLMGFTPLLGSMVGTFAKGGVIGETGYALVHRHERVLPDPEGPYGSQAMHGQSAPAPIIELHMSADLAALDPMIEAVVDGRSQRIVSTKTGRITRILAGAPGGRR